MITDFFFNYSSGNSMDYLDLPGVCLHNSSALHDEEYRKALWGSAHLPDPAGIIQIYVYLQLDL